MLFLKKNYKIFFLILLLGLIFYRSPYIFINGRFIAEEGSWWFANAHDNGPLSGLTYIYWGSSYYNFWANLSAVIASFFPLEIAPLVTVYMALIVKIYLFLYILYSDSNFLKSKFDKSIVSLILLLTPMMTSTIWLNTLVSQIYFTIIVILIFFQKENSKVFINKFSNLVIFISGFTSILSCFFTPFFLLKYIRNKNRYNFLRFFSSVIPFLFQLTIFIYSNIANITDENRFFLSLNKFANFLYNGPVKSILGTDLSKIIYTNIFSENIVIATLIVSFAIGFLIFIILYQLKKKTINDNVILYLLGFFILHSFLAIITSKYDQVQGRYAVIPSVLFILIIYRLFQINKNYLKSFFFSIIFLSICLGSFEYKLNNKYPHFLDCLDGCPNWIEEVKKWKIDPDYNLKIWDYPRKTMKLSQK